MQSSHAAVGFPARSYVQGWAADASPYSWAGAPALEFIVGNGRSMHARFSSPHCMRFSLPTALACIPFNSPHRVRSSLPQARACIPVSSPHRVRVSRPQALACIPRYVDGLVGRHLLMCLVVENVCGCACACACVRVRSGPPAKQTTYLRTYYLTHLLTYLRK